MNKIENILLEFFDTHLQATTKEIIEHTGIARRTVQKYISLLVEQGRLSAYGQGRGSWYERVYTSSEPLSHLAVLKNNIFVGKLSYGNGSYKFEYDSKYEGKEFIGILRGKDNQSPILYPIFENLLPEYERRNRLLGKSNEIADALIKLNNVQGDFKFIPYHELFKYKSTSESRPSWLTVKHKILGEDIYPNLINARLNISDAILEDRSNEEHSSLSGYQHKIDINIDFEKGIINEEIYHARYLLKPLNRTMTNYFAQDKNGKKAYYPFLALNEHLFMSFAKNELELDTPQSGIVLTKDGDFHYIVKRYDRYENFSYGQRDMAQQLNIPSTQKYNTDTLTVMEQFAEDVKDEQSRYDMLKFQVYSSLIKHSDFHAKNMGLLEVGKDKFIMSPLYDVISVGLYKGNENDLGLPLSETIRKYGKYDLDDYLQIARALKVGAGKSKNIIKQTIETFLDKFPEYIERTKTFEIKYDLKIQNTRIGKKLFSQSMQSMYERRLIQLKKQGILQVLGIVDKYGGALKSEITNSAKHEKLRTAVIDEDLETTDNDEEINGTTTNKSIKRNR